MHISPALLIACPAVDGSRPASASLDVYVSVERLRGDFVPVLEEVLDTSSLGTVIPVSILATQDSVTRAQTAAVNEAVAQAGDALGTAIITLDDKRVRLGHVGSVARSVPFVSAQHLSHIIRARASRRFRKPLIKCKSS